MAIAEENLQRKKAKPAGPQQHQRWEGLAQLPMTAMPNGLVQRMEIGAGQMMVPDLHYLQRTIGNRAVAQLMPPLPALQRTAASPVGAAGGAIDNTQAQQIHSPQGNGQAVPEQVRTQVEKKTGADLGAVRVHNNKSSHSLNHQLNAKAFTHRNQIFLGKGESPHDVQLMAHELTHTIQQTGGDGRAQRTPLIQRFTDEDAETGPTNWKDETVRVTSNKFHSTNPVFFMHDHEGNQLVVKVMWNDSLRDDEPGRVTFGEKILDKLGINTTRTRFVFNGNEEFHDIVDTIVTKSVTKKDGEEVFIEYGSDEREDYEQKVNRFQVMPFAKGKSMERQMSEVKSKKTANDHFDLWKDDDFAYFYKIGKLIVADLAMGNDDRFFVSLAFGGGSPANYGNLIFDDDGSMVAIDSTVAKGDPNTVGQDFGGAFATRVGNDIDSLFDTQTDGNVGPEEAQPQEGEDSEQSTEVTVPKRDIFLEHLLVDMAKQMNGGHQGKDGSNLNEIVSG